MLVPVEYRGAPEQRDHAAEREERPERDRVGACLASAAKEDHGSGHGREEEPGDERDDHGDSEAGTEEHRKLDVSHPHPARIDEHDEEQHEAGGERRHDPLEAGIVESADDDERGGSRQDDQIRDEAVLEVRARHDHEHPAEDDGGEGLERECVYGAAGSAQECRREDDERKRGDTGTRRSNGS